MAGGFKNSDGMWTNTLNHNLNRMNYTKGTEKNTNADRNYFTISLGYEVAVLFHILFQENR
jgi:hypothetical protein